MYVYYFACIYYVYFFKIRKIRFQICYYMFILYSNVVHVQFFFKEVRLFYMLNVNLKVLVYVVVWFGNVCYRE